MALSTAFDDVTNLSDITLSDDELDSVSNRLKNGANRRTKSDYATNYLNASTPTRLKSSSSSSHYNKYPPTYQNIRNVPRDDYYFSDVNDKVPFSLNEDDSEPFTVNRKYENVDYNQDLNKDNISSFLLLKNDNLIKELSALKEKCLKISSNYKTLNNKFLHLFDENKKNLDIIDRLRTNVSFLESKLENERHTNTKLNKKANDLEAQVDELKDLLPEHGRLGTETQTNEAHEKIIANMQQRHNKEMEQLRNQIEQLSLQKQKNGEDTCSKNATAEKQKKVFGNNFSTLAEKEINRLTKDKKTEEILKSMDEKMISLKEDWQVKLQDDVDKIIHWMGRSSIFEKDNGHQRWNENAVNSSPCVEFLPLQELFHHLQKSFTEREQRIEGKIARFKATKQQLEEALQESRMLSTSNLSNSSDRSLVLEELRDDLDKFKRESSVLSQKLSKYKRVYLQLQKKYEEDIENLKAQYARAVNVNNGKSYH